MKTTQEEKQETVHRILKQEAYSPDSGAYQMASKALMSLSAEALLAIDLLVVFRVMESNELTRRVERILSR